MPLTFKAGSGRGEGLTGLCHRVFCPCTVPGPLQNSSFEEGITKSLPRLLKMRCCLYQPQVMNLVASGAVNGIITKMSNKNKMRRASRVLCAINKLYGRGNMPVQTLVVQLRAGNTNEFSPSDSFLAGLVSVRRSLAPGFREVISAPTCLEN